MTRACSSNVLFLYGERKDLYGEPEPFVSFPELMQHYEWMIEEELDEWVNHPEIDADGGLARAVISMRWARERALSIYEVFIQSPTREAEDAVREEAAAAMMNDQSKNEDLILIGEAFQADNYYSLAV